MGISNLNSFIVSFLRFLENTDLMLNISWNEYRKIKPPFPLVDYSVKEVTSRYSRNGYDWDIHGTLYLPDAEIFSKTAIVMVHGGGVNELTFDKTPNNTLGWARVIASQGFRVLTVSYPGLWPPKGVWSKPPPERKPIFLLDREISSGELRDRILKYTFNLVVQGISLLIDQNLSNNGLLVFGHSIGSRLVVDLWKFIKTSKITGILGFGSLGPKVWEDELQEILRQKKGLEKPKETRPSIDELTRFQTILSGTQKPRIFLPILRTSVQLEECVKLSGLSRKEYFDNTLTKDPKSSWLRNMKILLVVGKNDNLRYWPKNQPLEFKPAYYVAKKFSEKADRTKLVIVPRFGHTGHLEPHSEKIIFLWLWAIKSGFFSSNYFT